jgi:hypothetical protein
MNDIRNNNYSTVSGVLKKKKKKKTFIYNK